MKIVKPDAQTVDKERYLRKPAYLESDIVDLDIDTLVWEWLDICKVTGGYHLKIKFSDFIKERISPRV